jgi:hypothetical protein
MLIPIFTLWVNITGHFTMRIRIDLEQGQEQQLNLFLQQHQLELSEFVKLAILDKLTQETKVINLPYELGKTVFGRFSSGDTERSVQRKQLIRDKIYAKHCDR